MRTTTTPPPGEELERLRRARRTFFEQGKLPRGVLDDAVTDSWRRCNHEGLDALSRQGGDACHDARVLRERRQRNEALLASALPELETIYQQIAHTNSAVILTDADGILLHRVGDPEFNRKAARVALQPGACWHESARGTNAVGTALAAARPVSVHGPEHYLDCNGFLTCAAAPIHGPLGEMIGVLDVSGDQVSRQLHTLGLVRMASLMVENRLLESRFEDAVYLYFHPRREFVGTLGQGIAAFSGEGRLLAANASALTQWQCDRDEAVGLPFEHLFQARLDPLPDSGDGEMFSLRLSTGLQVNARLVRRHEKRAATARPQPAPPAKTALDRLHFGDPAMAACVDKARRIAGRGIPVLIEGETGTGKERLAEALHQAGPRAAGPLVTINCAAIPESLIEAELFGYVAGAFTGARRDGATGRIQQAAGGTLFLDEIGDMPLALQTRFLRVLQEKQIVPVGGSRALDVDFELISATNQDLEQRVAEGAFRADLFYRLNGLRLTLPPLRERRDLGRLIDALVASEAPGTTLDEECRRALEHHPWPGNIRQLINVLRTALVLREPGRPLGLAALPEDLFRAPPLPVTGRDSLRSLTDAAIDKALAVHGGNMSAAARSLGVNRSTLHRRLKRLGK